MGVISFDKHGDVWGAASRIIYAMLIDMQRLSGPRPFLAKFIRAFDQGYNAIGLEDISVAEHEEFSRLLRRLVEKELWRRYANGKAQEFELEVIFQRLEQMTEASLANRLVAKRQERPH